LGRAFGAILQVSGKYGKTTLPDAGRIIANPAVACPITGARNLAQLQPSPDSSDIEMTPELYARIATSSCILPTATDRLDEQRKPDINDNCWL